MEDSVDRFLGQCVAASPGLDVSPANVVARLTRAARRLELGMKEHFAREDLETWEFDTLATLLRSNAEHTMCMKDLASASLLSSGALTNRMDRLVARGLVERGPAPGNRRMVLVTLTEEGARLTRSLLDGHIANKRRMLAGLTDDEQDQLAGLLRKLLISMGDVPDPE
ncbi:MarR family transcriptional regulator [Nonomuraea sp. NPDC050310]|uniref:MarR family winged helix-turn-helix transcriptional regulator n=1 Tax=unclassified Nonomuraea TaxID=2593643 RepID=UPI0033F478A0